MQAYFMQLIYLIGLSRNWTVIVVKKHLHADCWTTHSVISEHQSIIRALPAATEQ